jgi:hypothetical protein
MDLMGWVMFFVLLKLKAGPRATSNLAKRPWTGPSGAKWRLSFVITFDVFHLSASGVSTW